MRRILRVRTGHDAAGDAEVDEFLETVFDVQPQAPLEDISASTSNASSGLALSRRSSPARNGDCTSVRKRASSSPPVGVDAMGVVERGPANVIQAARYSYRPGRRKGTVLS